MHNTIPKTNTAPVKTPVVVTQRCAQGVVLMPAKTLAVYTVDFYPARIKNPKPTI